LDGLQIDDVEGAVFLALLGQPELHVDDGPDAALEKTFIAAVKLLGDVNFGVAEVIHGGPVFILAWEEADLDPVDEPMSAFLLDHGLGLVRLVVAEVIRRQGFFDGVHADADFLVVVRSTVFAQEILEHIGRNVLAAFDLVQKVLPHHFPGEHARCFLVQVVLLHSGLLNRASRSSASASPTRRASAGRSP